MSELRDETSKEEVVLESQRAEMSGEANVSRDRTSHLVGVQQEMLQVLHREELGRDSSGQVITGDRKLLETVQASDFGGEGTAAGRNE